MHQSFSLEISRSCQESWAGMETQEKGKFCLACQKPVVDFTGYTDTQLAAYFKKHTGERVCGRLNNAQLNRPMPLPGKTWRGLNYFWKVALPLWLGMTKVSAQTNSTIIPTTQVAPVREGNRNTTLGEPLVRRSVSGIVREAEGMPLPGATILLKGTQKGVVSDEEGAFRLFLTDGDPEELVVSAVGYVPMEYRIVTDSVLQVDMQLSGELMGDVVVVGYVVRKPAPLPELINRQAGLSTTNLKLFPNPVRAGQSLHIRPEFGNGIKQVVLVNAAGQTVWAKEWTRVGAGFTGALTIPGNLQSGNYFIQVWTKDESVPRTQALRIN